jgi:hypothetical protein
VTISGVAGGPCEFGFPVAPCPESDGDISIAPMSDSMKPSWGLIVAFALVVASLFVFGSALRLYVGSLLADSSRAGFTQEQFDAEMAKWKTDARSR